MAQRTMMPGSFNVDYLLWNDPRRSKDCPLTPSQWFAEQYPEAAQRWGSPFLQYSYCVQEDGFTDTEHVPTAINEDFFAAVLGGKQSLRHSIVFYLPEQTFYFRDYDQIFYPTTEQKLALLISNLLMKCCQDMQRDKHIRNIFVEFRKPEQIRAIIQKAKTMLAVEKEFFSEFSINRRKNGPEVLAKSARVFVVDKLVRREGQLAIGTTQDRFSEYCVHNQVGQVKRRQSRPLLIEAVQDQFGMGLRHDLVDESGKKCQGWTGIGFANHTYVTNN